MQIYFINLASRPDRRAEMETQLARLGLAARRIEAITPADIAAADKRLFCDPRHFHWLTETELACSLSHIRAYQAIIDTGAPFGLVFEDDVVLSDSLPAMLAAFEAAPPAVDIVKLEAGPDTLRVDPGTPIMVGRTALRQVHSYAAGAAGYIVSRRTAERLVRQDWMRRIQTDSLLFNPYARLVRSGLVMRHADPALCVQLEMLRPADTGAASNIGAARSSRADLERGLTAPVRLLHRLRTHYERDILMGVQKSWHQLVGGARKRTIPFSPD
jgi:glycosyl transferase family 25